MPKARAMTRRKSVRANIPCNVPIPKFMTPNEVAEAIKLHKENPRISWKRALHEAVMETKNKNS